MCKKTLSGLLALLLLLALCASAPAADKKTDLIFRGQKYVEATGTAIAPKNASGAQAKALARRGAIVDLHRNLLKYISGGQTEVRGFINGVQLIDGKWNGESYTVTGRISRERLRMFWEYYHGLNQYNR